MVKTLFQKAKIITMLDCEIIEGDILVSGSRIEAIGQIDPQDLDNSEIQIIDCSNTIAMPGLINTHTHAAMTLLRSYADDMELMPWLNEMIWPAEAKMTDEHIYWGTKLAILEMIRSGTTTFTDMYSSMDQVAKAVDESGIRANLSRGLIVFSDPELKNIEESKQFYSHWHNQSDGRIKVWFAPHAPYTCPPEYIEKIVDAAKQCNTGIHIHVAETLDEIQQMKDTYGKTPVEYLADLGVFDVPAIAAHCVYLTESDIDIMSKKQVGVAHNVVSNLKLASGIAPIDKYKKAGIAVGLGTDGASSNNSLNMLKEINTCSLIHKVNQMDPTAMNAYQVLELATIGGAKALRWDQEIGTLEVGKKADIILIDINKPHFAPYHNEISDIVYAAQGSDVKLTMVDGKILMQDYKILGMNEDEIIAQATRCAKEICS